MSLILNRYLNEFKTKRPKSCREPINDKEAELLKRLVKEKFNLILPHQYIDFLKLTNSFNFDGELIYGMDLKYMNGNNGREHGIIEYNEIYHADELSKRFFFFGDGNMDAYVLDIEKGNYYFIDKFSHESIKEFENFNSMIEYILKYLVERLQVNYSDL